jgi:vacuolar-type H+-ATPase subunit I/STV1
MNLGPQDEAQLKTLIETYRDCDWQVNELVDEINAKIRDLNAVLIRTNATIREIDKFGSGFAEEVREYASEQSSRWQKSETAEDYHGWANRWEDLAMELEEQSPVKEVKLELSSIESVESVPWQI